MTALSIQHPLFKLIISEHTEVKNLMASADIANQDSFRSSLNKIWQLNEVEHHHKEEIFLFNQVYQHPLIHSGGPMCGLFFDFHMFENFKTQVEAITQHPLNQEPHQASMIEGGSPIVIPLEEHRAGKDLLNDLIKNFDKFSDENRRKYFDLYKTIQLSHFQKEEECFFHLCAMLLSTDQADSILKQWQNTKID